MDRNKIEDLLAEGESEKIEFKTSFGKEVMESISAFGNTKGGYIIIGITDKGKLCGINVGKDTLRDLANKIAQCINISPSLEVIQYKGKNLIIIEVPEGHTKPVTYKGKAFKRVGTTNQLLSDVEFAQMVLETRRITPDELIEAEATIDDIDLQKVEKFVEFANQIGRRPIPQMDSPIKIIEKLSLIKGAKPTRACILLFGKEPQRFYPNASVKIGRFRTETLIVDEKEIKGVLFEQIEDAMIYFRERLQLKLEITSKPQRDIRWEYPLEALREGVINALCHRDYLATPFTQIRIYDDRIVIWNPGSLPKELTVEELKREHSSIPRNLKIAEIFYYAGYIERWGTGTLKILEECKKENLPEPEFLINNNSFKLVLKKKMEELESSNWANQWHYRLCKGKIQSYVVRGSEPHEKIVKTIKTYLKLGRITISDLKKSFEEIAFESGPILKEEWDYREIKRRFDMLKRSFNLN